MSQVTLHPTPALSVVAREQFRVIGGVLRRDAAVLLLIALAPSIPLVIAIARGDDVRRYFTPSSASAAIILAFLAGIQIWKGNEPSRRGYDLAMPCDPRTHALLRVASGWFWVMGIAAVYLLWSLLFAWLTGSEIGSDRFLISWHLSNSREAAGTVAEWLRWSVPAWQWISIFTGATIAYLLASIAALASAHPGRWIGGAFAVLIALYLLAAPGNTAGVATFLAEFFGGRYGMSAAFTGAQASEETIRWATPEGSATFTATAMKPALGAWLVAMPLWLGVGLIGTLLAARPRR